MISTANAHMLQLLADILHDRTPGIVSPDEWPTLFKELRAQAVYALPAEHISVLGLPEKEESAYLREIIRNRQTFHKLMREQDRVLSALDEAGIPVVVLKGAAAAISYSHPENRCMGDIDLLVMPQDFARARDTLIAAGCTAANANPNYTRHIALFTESNVEIELHNFFSSSDNPEQNALLDDILYQAIPQRISCELCGYRVSMLPPTENGLVLLGHINHHLSVGLGLRQIIDWMCFVEKYLDDSLWENGFSDLAEKIGMKRLAMITTAMCQKYLGLQKDIHWCKYEPVCDELMEYILSHGNFGTKEAPVQRKTSSVLKQFRNPFRGLATAQSRGLINWEAAKKHRWLRPFAWCYQFGRWFKKGLEGGITPQLLGDASSSAKEGAELMKKLGVTRL